MFFTNIHIDFNKIGYFSFQHIVSLVLLFMLIPLMLFISVKFFPDKTSLQLKILCVVSWIAEIIKIIITYAIGAFTWKTILPLYFCSMFLYSSFLAAFCKNPVLKLIGNSSLMAGTVAGFFGLFYAPALKYYPVYTYLGAHTLIYHAIMIYCGVLILLNNYYVPKAKDILYSSILFLTLTLAACFANVALDANYMFINTPLEGAPTYIIVEIFSAKLYPVIVILGQIILPFFIMLGIYNLAAIKTKKRPEKKGVYADEDLMEKLHMQNR
ncbi:MAG TPA: hypothetical protein VIL23_01495 [Clostridia bacterium]